MSGIASNDRLMIQGGRLLRLRIGSGANDERYTYGRHLEIRRLTRAANPISALTCYAKPKKYLAQESTTERG